jgi:hypothetical protein
MCAAYYLEGGRIYGNHCRRHPYQNIYTRCLYGAAAGTVAASTITLDGSGVYILDLEPLLAGANVIIKLTGAPPPKMFSG